MADPPVQVEGSRLLCVLGPQVTAHYLSSLPGPRGPSSPPSAFFPPSSSGTASSPACPAALTYRGLVESGVRRSLEVEEFSTEEERGKREALLQHAYELEPAFTAHKVVETLKAHGCYEKWLEDCFSPLQEGSSALRSPNGTSGSGHKQHVASSGTAGRIGRKNDAVLQWLTELQESGALLAYTHYDTVLSEALGQRAPLLLDDLQATKAWAVNGAATGSVSGRGGGDACAGGSASGGILHLHGVHSLPDTLKLNCICYDTTVGECAGADVLRDVCSTRHLVMVGFDGEFHDPFLLKFANTFYSAARLPEKYPLVISTSLVPPSPYLGNPSVLTLQIPSLSSLVHNNPFSSSAACVSSHGASSCVGAGLERCLTTLDKHGVCVCVCVQKTEGSQCMCVHVCSCVSVIWRK